MICHLYRLVKAHPCSSNTPARQIAFRCTVGLVYHGLHDGGVEKRGVMSSTTSNNRKSSWLNISMRARSRPRSTKVRAGKRIWRFDRNSYYIYRTCGGFSKACTLSFRGAALKGRRFRVAPEAFAARCISDMVRVEDSLSFGRRPLLVKPFVNIANRSTPV